MSNQIEQRRSQLNNRRRSLAVKRLERRSGLLSRRLAKTGDCETHETSLNSNLKLTRIYARLAYRPLIWKAISSAQPGSRIGLKLPAVAELFRWQFPVGKHHRRWLIANVLIRRAIRADRVLSEHCSPKMPLCKSIRTFSPFHSSFFYSNRPMICSSAIWSLSLAANERR